MQNKQSRRKVQTIKMIDDSDWDGLVSETYGRPYRFQQQDGCKERGTFNLRIPEYDYDYERDTIPETNSTNEMGVSFKAWLERDPKQHLKDEESYGDEQWAIDIWWERNFYPAIESVANDLYNKGFIEAGEYVINIDW